MAALRTLELEIEEFTRKRHKAYREDLARRVEETTRQMAEMGVGSPLFKALRESYMESDPEFRARMEAMADHA